MKVHWTENAIEHLVNIYEYIAHNSPTYAKRFVDKITRRSEQIIDHPLSGRRSDTSNHPMSLVLVNYLIGDKQLVLYSQFAYCFLLYD